MQNKYWAIKFSIIINYCVFAILLNSVGTVILQVQNSFGVTESAASVLEAYKDFSIALVSFLVAAFIARAGYKRTMLFGLGFIGLVCLAMPQMPTFWMNKLMFAATGASFALIKVSVFATIGLITDGRKQHVSMMNFIEAFFMVAVLSGYFVFSGFIDDTNPGSLSWFDVYYVLSALSFLAFLLLLFTSLDESDVEHSPSESALQDFIGMLTLCFKPLVLTFVISIFLYVLIEQGIMSWLPTFNNQILSLPTSLSIQMTSILAGSIALGRFIAGFVSKKVDWYPMLVTSLLLAAGLVLVALPLAESADLSVPTTGWLTAPIAAFIFPLIGLCLAPIYPIINSVMLSALKKHQQAAMTGLIVVFSALGGTTGSLITGTLFEHFGGATAFYCSLIPIAIILLMLGLFRHQIGKLERAS
ncbi:MAG: FHS family glucose/mannose:H+ symporter-like MFS transporter [Arenicella sp.]